MARKLSSSSTQRRPKATIAQKLSRYRAKRDFERSGEPRGAHRLFPASKLRYVVQKHAARQLHYDLRLEVGGVFRSWAVPKGPSLDPRQKRLAVEVEDHPLEYGDFEGSIPKGEYGAGTVMVWDRGAWTPVDTSNPGEALKNGELKFQLNGKKLKGEFVLLRTAGRGLRSRRNWLLIKRKDAHALDDGDAELLNGRSVASNRTMKEIAARRGRRPRSGMRLAAATHK